MPVRKEQIGAARFLVLKIRKVESSSVQKMCAEIEARSSRGTAELYGQMSLYAFLNSRMRIVHKIMLKSRSRRA